MAKLRSGEPYSHCAFCGALFPPGAGWPRVCERCGSITYRNPLPVSVVLVPVEEHGRHGLLVIRRGIAPRQGELALPGGFINYGETWQEAGAREVFEETGLAIDPAEMTEYHVRSAPDGTLIIFGLAAPRPVDALPPFLPNAEATERLVISAPAPMAFPLHAEMVARFFDASR